MNLLSKLLLIFTIFLFSKALTINKDSLKFDVPLSTNGTKIIDSKGNPIKLSCVNWYGAHMDRYVVNGLDLIPLDVISHNISSMGFNCVRLVYSLE